MFVRFAVRIVAAAVLALLPALFLPPGPAEAHANLLRSSPSANDVLSAPPAEVQVWFDEAIEPEFGHLEVHDADGRRVDNLDARYFDDAGTPSLIVTLPRLPDGTYVVTWVHLRN